jgi:glutaredoxin
MRLTVVVAAILIVATGVCRAEVYRYTDSAGELHFVDDLSKVPKKYRKQLEKAKPLRDIAIVDATPAAPPPQGSTVQEKPKPQEKSYSSATVEVFITPWCGYCKKMVRFLEEKGIPFTSYDIEKDSAAARVHRELGGRGVPVVRVGSHVIHGFKPDAVLAHLNGGK